MLFYFLLLNKFIQEPYQGETDNRTKYAHDDGGDQHDEAERR